MNPSTLQARVIVDELIRGGVRDAVLCPGSRNAPLAFALHAADAAGRLRLHVRIDERSAGYLALGLAVADRRPVPIVMTSGTAVANMSPAVFEANYARVPLVVISANRPYELLGSGANQTVEQFGIFGTQVRAAISLGLAEEDLDTNSQWRSAVGRVLAAARGARTGNAGPVQFDIPLREPLVPDAGDDPAASLDEVAGGRFAGRPGGAPWTSSPVGKLDIPIEIDLSEDTVVIAGHGAGVHPELAGVPTVAEPTAPRPADPLHPLALPGLRPKQAIICGRPTLHRSVSRLLADPNVRVYALTTGPRWPDVSGNVYATGSRAEVLGAPSEQWLRTCAQAQERVTAAVAAELDAPGPVTGLHVARAVAGAVRAGDRLVLGASNPVRDVALAGAPVADVRVLSNRGVAGIDGANSTALGAALADDGDGSGRTIALFGDLTFVHDATGLIIGPDEPRPRSLRIVVANDDGGGIFGLLEQGDQRFATGAYAGVNERIFGTPHRTDLAALCAGFSVPFARVAVDELPAALDAPIPAGGIEVLEVVTEREPLRTLHERIAARLR